MSKYYDSIHFATLRILAKTAIQFFGCGSGALPRLKASPSLALVWAPARLFFKLEKHNSAVLVPDTSEAATLIS